VLTRTREFFRRQTVIELTGAVAVAWATFSFLQAAFRGLVISPIMTASPDPVGNSLWGRGYFTLGGRVFDWIDPLAALAVLGLIVGALAGLLRVTKASSERPLRECPFCLEDIPAAAAVCSYCTRDLA
jgi:hypothetical protein